MSHTPDSYARSAARLELARRRQELAMRWVVLTTIVVCVLLCGLATMVHGPPTLPGALVQGSLVGLLSWIVRKLFGP